MIMSYRQVKEDVLKMYDEFLPVVSLVREKDGKSTYEKRLEILKEKADNIKKDIFRLMIVGEANSGKSTFINAYLGKEILPMDVKQCTSAIVEIRYGNKYILKATYADDTVRIFENEEKIRTFLRENAALDDKFRDIPVGMINLHLIIPGKGKRIIESEIKDFLKIIEKDNHYKLPREQYEKKVRTYINEKLPHWREIVKKIEIEYPFDDEDLKGVQIMDSPGVNAEGRVGEITNEYIGNADAVMFLKPLVGTSLDATSFKNFLETASADRRADAMFLVLTRAANETGNNIQRILDDAYKQFPNINKKQIIHLDSKVELFRKQIKNMSEEELQAYMNKQLDSEDLDSFLQAPWFRSRCEREDYLRRLSVLSNFTKMDEALNQFARKAHYIFLSQFLQDMLTVFEKIKAEQEENVRCYREKAENPLELASRLADAENRLKDLQNKINVTLKNITSRYKDDGGLIEARARKELAAYRKEIAGIDPKSPHSVDDLEKATFRKIDLLAEFEGEISKNIVAECNKELIALSGKSKLNYISLKPDITQEVIKSIELEQRKNAEETYTTGFACFEEVHTKVNPSRYFDLVRKEIDRRVDKRKDDIVIALQEYVTNVTSAYRRELTDNISEQEKRYRKIREDKATAEEMQEKIRWMEDIVKKVDSISEDIEALKGGIDRYVG